MCVCRATATWGVILTWPTPSGKVSPEDLKACFFKQGVEMSPHLDTKNNNNYYYYYCCDYHSTSGVSALHTAGLGWAYCMFSMIASPSVCVCVIFSAAHTHILCWCVM